MLRFDEQSRTAVISAKVTESEKEYTLKVVEYSPITTVSDFVRTAFINFALRNEAKWESEKIRKELDQKIEELAQ